MVIKPVKTHKEFHEVENLQQQIWKFPDREIIPVNELITAQNNGGVVLGAFENGKMAGFVFGIAGYKNGKPFHCSRMLAVLHQWQNRGLGYKLKMAQRKFALKQSLNLMKWTFDPLQSRNAYFNLERLGVIVREYFVNLYGESTAIFNQGFQTDRFIAEWHFKRVKKAMSGKLMKSACLVNKATIKAGGLAFPETPYLSHKAPILAVEIPSDIDKLKAKSLELAKKWRHTTREIFTHYLVKRYIITNFFVQFDGRNQRSFYIMQK